MKTHADAIDFFGGTVLDPLDYPATRQGFDEYRRASGVEHFSTREMLEPNKMHLAAALGMYLFLPEREWWPRMIACAKIADTIRDLVESPVRGRNWWRPIGYNKAVGGATKSDHLTAHAVDLDYVSGTHRARAEAWLVEIDDAAPWLQLSIGLGFGFHHVGIMSPEGRRAWAYGDRSQDPDAVAIISRMNRK